MQMQVQLDQTTNHLIERDKEIKLYRMKIQEMMHRNFNSNQSAFDVESLMSGKSYLGAPGGYAKSELGNKKAKLQQLSIDVSSQYKSKGAHANLVSSRVAAANTELEKSTIDKTSLSSVIVKPSSQARTRAKSIDPAAKKLVGVATSVNTTKQSLLPSSISYPNQRNESYNAYNYESTSHESTPH